MLVSPHMFALMEASSRRLSGAAKSLIRQFPGEPRRDGTSDARRQRYQQILAEVHDPKIALETLERIINGNDLTDVAYLLRGAMCARSVCRIEIRSDNNFVVGYGTGFLVAPGVVMTNHHVIDDPALVRRSIVWFDYERDLQGREKTPVEFSMVDEQETITQADLDFSLVRLAPRDKTGSTPNTAFRWLRLSSASSKTLENEYLTIIQHPAAQLKQICVRENRLLAYEGDNLLRYQTDTLGGSSGSPVFNQSWQVVGLHHSGVPDKDPAGRIRLTDGTWYDPANNDPPIDESRIKWIANEGIRVSAILNRLKDRFNSCALARAVLDAPANTFEAASGLDDSGGGLAGPNAGVRYSVDGRKVRMFVPVEITVGLGGALAAAGPDAAPSGIPPTPPPPPAGPQPAPGPCGPTDTPPPGLGVDIKGAEALTIKKDYKNRNGFDPKFLGADKRFLVPLPKPAPHVAAELTIDGVKTTELKYWNFSVALHAKRKLALFSAGNVDFSKKKAQSGDATWIDDDRAKGKQIGRDFYKKQAELESDRTSNPFDQGHLHMQAHATWGDTAAQANKFGADTFHYPNCAPQFFQYNQGHPDVQAPGDKGTKLWRGLEDFIAQRFTTGSSRKCSIITGPIFDAPNSPRKNGQPEVHLTGKSSPDPTFGGISIPKMFYKVICAVKADNLAVSAFVISQEDYLEKIDRLKPGTNEAFINAFAEALTQSQARLYRVSIEELEHATKLDFGPLKSTAVAWLESSRAVGRQIKSWDDLA